jgi:hypothetical protein
MAVALPRGMRLRFEWTWGMALCAIALGVGCGDSVVEVDGEGGNAGSGATAGSGGTGAAAGTGGTGGGGAGACAAYDDEEGHHAVTIRFRNDSGMSIYLPANCGRVSFMLQPLGGDDAVAYAFDPFCLQTC